MTWRPLVGQQWSEKPLMMDHDGGNPHAEHYQTPLISASGYVWAVLICAQSHLQFQNHDQDFNLFESGSQRKKVKKMETLLT